MSDFGHCPKCGNEIPDSRQFNGMVVCECGWTNSSANEEARASSTDKICIRISIFAAILVIAFLQVVNWDIHAFSIVPLKVAQYTGFASTETLEKIVTICSERKKTSCTEDALMQIWEKDSNNTDALERLGELQTQLGNSVDALKTYDLLFGLKDVKPNDDSRFNYAKALAANEKNDEAERLFRKILKSKPNTLQITVTRHYIKLLVKNEKYGRAKATLDHFRRKGKNTRMFMQKEYKEIQKKLSRSVASR